MTGAPAFSCRFLEEAAPLAPGSGFWVPVGWCADCLPFGRPAGCSVPAGFRGVAPGTACPAFPLLRFGSRVVRDGAGRDVRAGASKPSGRFTARP
ncbi:hypothetical protein ACFFGH_27510 [Lysobacter korlensis]|uniref:Uncharacterized protein n=1 Tax=Lysobacter korlensis TaxID=553636 RepID=A0ABV6RYB8_9GAMM